MERKLRALFDYQKFEKNAALAEIIADTESRMNFELADDDLSMVAAAGEASKPDWLQENSGESSAWYGVDNSTGTFEPGSRLWERWLNNDRELNLN